MALRRFDQVEKLQTLEQLAEAANSWLASGRDAQFADRGKALADLTPAEKQGLGNLISQGLADPAGPGWRDSGQTFRVLAKLHTAEVPVTLDLSKEQLLTLKDQVSPRLVPQSTEYNPSLTQTQVEQLAAHSANWWADQAAANMGLEASPKTIDAALPAGLAARLQRGDADREVDREKVETFRTVLTQILVDRAQEHAQGPAHDPRYGMDALDTLRLKKDYQPDTALDTACAASGLAALYLPGKEQTLAISGFGGIAIVKDNLAPVEGSNRLYLATSLENIAQYDGYRNIAQTVCAESDAKALTMGDNKLLLTRYDAIGQTTDLGAPVKATLTTPDVTLTAEGIRDALKLAVLQDQLTRAGVKDVSISLLAGEHAITHQSDSRSTTKAIQALGDSLGREDIYVDQGERRQILDAALNREAIIIEFDTGAGTKQKSLSPENIRDRVGHETFDAVAKERDQGMLTNQRPPTQNAAALGLDRER